MIHVWIEGAVRPVFPLSRCELQRLIEAVIRFFGWRVGDIEVEVTTDRVIAEMNTKHMGLPGPTNVLSFPLDVDPEAGLNGGIVLSAHTLQREAELYAQNETEHCLRLVVHSLLHLAGLEHSPEMEAMTEAGLEAALQDADGYGP